MAKLLPFLESDRNYFKDVKAIVEADYYTLHSLWNAYHNAPLYGRRIDSWKEESAGHGITIGKMDRRPVCIVLWWAILNGHRVMFWEATSQVVDYKMVQDWFRHFKTRDMVSCDANNFHRVLEITGSTVCASRRAS